jgi:adenylate kinase family enzyme
MNPKLNTTQRILIVGDAGRGKTTLAQKLSEKLRIPFHSTDDFFWKTKFSERHDIGKSIDEISKVYAEDEWIIEGTTRRLVEPGFKRADLIVYLSFRNVLSQWWALIKRNRTRKNETVFNLIKFLRHVLYKRYGLGYKRGEPKILELLQPYSDKLVILHSHKEIDEFTEE